MAADRVGRRDVEHLVARQVGLDREHDGVAEVVHVDVRAVVPDQHRGIADDRAEVPLVASLVLDPGRPDRRAADVRPLDRPLAEQLAEPLGGRVRILRPDRMLLVDRQVLGPERPVGEDEPRHRLAGEVDEAARARSDRRLEHVERAHACCCRRRRAAGCGSAAGSRPCARRRRSRARPRTRRPRRSGRPASSPRARPGSGRSQVGRARSVARTS